MAVGWNVANRFSPMTGEQATGAPKDLASSLMKGYRAAFEPQNLAQKLLDMQLTNKINAPKAEDAQGWYDLQKRMHEATAGATESNTGLDPYRRDLMIAQTHAASNKLDPIETLRLKLAGKQQEIENASNQKKVDSLEEKIMGLKESGADLYGINQILENNPSATGLWANLANLWSGNPDLAGINERSVNLQSHLARAMSDRGGAAVANMVNIAKPSGWRNVESNKGSTKAGMQRVVNEYNEARDEYRRRTGHDLPENMRLPAEYEGMLKTAAENAAKKASNKNVNPRNKNTGKKESESTYKPYTWVYDKERKIKRPVPNERVNELITHESRRYRLAD